MLISLVQRFVCFSAAHVRGTRLFRHCSRGMASNAARASADEPATGSLEKYQRWSKDALINRLITLETSLRATSSASASTPEPLKPRPKKPNKPFDPSKYTTRHIALKFAYLGQSYNGFEHHANNKTPLPTIEEELWKALVKTRLIFKEPQERASRKGDITLDWEGCEYSKCGRTDKGVSAFGQVVGIRVRSLKPVSIGAIPERSCHAPESDEPEIRPSRTGQEGESSAMNEDQGWHSVDDELPYPRILNRVLPEDIRVLAWAPTPHEAWSARFDCRERRYRYFFTQPCFSPLPGHTGILSGLTSSEAEERDGWLNIEAMRKAATFLQGTHDFRNFCKLDPGKQIENFCRDIRHADIHELGPSDPLALNYLRNTNVQPVGIAQEPKVYYFEVHGSAFLWHQVRHLVAVLFLVGQGFEEPQIVREMLDVGTMKSKPFYEMADDAPLVLWDCLFPSADGPQHVDALEWIYPDQQTEARDRRQAFSSSGDGRYGPGGVNEVLWSGWRRKKIDEVLARSLLDIVAGQGSRSGFGNPRDREVEASAKVFDGSNRPRMAGKYIRIQHRRRMDPVELQNARYAERKGLPAKAEAMDADP